MTTLIIDFGSQDDKQRLWEVLRQVKGVNTVEIKKYRKKRPTKYYFKEIVNPLASAFGYTPEQMHEELKRMFNPVVQVNRLTGEQVVFGGSTQGFTPEQANAYYARIREWAMSEWSINLSVA